VLKDADLVESEEYRRFAMVGDPDWVLARRSQLVEGLLRATYYRCLVPVGGSGLALVATGGLGRRELYPYSDVDLLILARPGAIPALRQAIARFVQALWDAGLRVGHSVRTPAQCCVLAPDTAELLVSLLDRRLLAGDEDLYSNFEERFTRFVSARAGELGRWIADQTWKRHRQFDHTIYHLEPDVKEAPGGLRDLHVLHWLALLEKKGSRERPSPWPWLARARRLLGQARCFLHWYYRRDLNRLSFEAQDQLASLPFAASDAASWMREYYAVAREVYRDLQASITELDTRRSPLLAAFRDWRSRARNVEFTTVAGKVYLRNPSHLAHDPEMALRLFEFCARHGLPLASETTRHLRRLAPWLKELFAAPGPYWRWLYNICAAPHASLALRAMADAGILHVLLPEWELVDCLVVRDFYHRYTVDEHCFRAIELLERLGTSAGDPHSRFARLREETGELALLKMALLLHDLGKAMAQGNHVQHSASLAEQICERIQMPLLQRRHLLFLIRHHLDLSSVLARRDLEDPSTARDVAALVGTVEALRDLVLLTWADISAVHPQAMTAWREDQLWRLYLAAHRALVSQLSSDPESGTGLLDPELACFVLGFPERYRHLYSPEEIRHHQSLANTIAATGAAVEMRQVNGVYEATVVTTDRPGLLTCLTGTLAAFGMNILKADAFTNANGVVVDRFVFEDPAGLLRLEPDERHKLEAALRKACRGEVDPAELLRSRRWPTRSKGRLVQQPAVWLRNDLSDRATYIEIVAGDRPGLLYDICQLLHRAGCNIEFILADTQGPRAFDVLYVTRAGRQLSAREQQELRIQLLSVLESLPVP